LPGRKPCRFMASPFTLVSVPRLDCRRVRVQRADVVLDGYRRLGRGLTLGTVGVLATSVLWVATGVMRVASTQPSDGLLAAVAAAVYLPPHLRHAWCVAHGRRPRGALLGLGFMAVVIVAVLPVIGAQWLSALYPLAGSVLLVLRPPWSLAGFGALVVAVPVLAYVFGQSAWAFYFCLGVFLYGLLYATPVWLVAAIRELRAARGVLAEEAVARERLHLDAQLRQTLGVALDTIATVGDRAVSAIGSAPDQAEDGLRGVVGAARGALAEARRMTAGFRHSRLGEELDAAVALLRGAGVDAHLERPDGVLPEVASDEVLAALRAEVTRLLHDGAVRRCVIAVRADARLEIRSAGAGPGAERVVAV
jgi:two-component system sensor histidine kinase DesK